MYLFQEKSWYWYYTTHFIRFKMLAFVSMYGRVILLFPTISHYIQGTKKAKTLLSRLWIEQDYYTAFSSIILLFTLHLDSILSGLCLKR